MFSVIRALTAVVACTLVTSPGSAEEWRRFRGPNGSGVSASTGLPVEFGPDKNVAWSVEIPSARSSPVLADGKIFLTAIDGDRFSTLALDEKTGKILWHRQIERDRTTEMYQGTDSASPSPVTDGANVYAFFQETGLVSYDGRGEERWRHPLGPFQNFYGIAASPVLSGNTLILVCDQMRGSFLLAVDKDTGKELWRQERSGRLLSYATPILYPDARNPREVIVVGNLWVDAYDLESGKSTWVLGGLGVDPVSSPVLAGDLLFTNTSDHAPEPPPPFSELADKHDTDGNGVLSHSEVKDTWMYNHFGYLDWDGDGTLSAKDWHDLNESMATGGWGIAAIRVPSGNAEATVVWRSQQSVPYIPTGLVYEGVLFMVKDGIVSALHPETGELLKRGRLTKGSPKVHASPVAADGKIYIATREGQVAVLSAGADWEVLAMNDLEDEIHASPAIADGHLYVRTKSKLYSFASQGE